MVKKRKKRICFIATVDFVINAFLLKQIHKLSYFFEVTVIVNTSDKYFLKKQGVDATVINLPFSRGINFLNDLYCLCCLIHILFRGGYSAVHSFTPKAGLLGMLASFISGVPKRIHTFTGQVWITKTGIYRYFLKKIDTIISFLSNYSIVDSPSQAKFLFKENILSQNKLIVFGSGSISGVDLDKFKPSKKIFIKVRGELLIPQNAFVFLYLGRLNKDKGVLDLAKAFSKIKNDRAFLVVVGPDEANFGNQMKILCGPNQDRMKLVGYSNEPQKYLAGADVLCLPSYREGFGSVIIEAAAMGLPSIASDIYGISDAVKNQKTGLLHPPKNIEEIIKCMNILLSDSRLLKAYGLEANKRAIKKFDANIMTRHWLNFYLKNIY
jgi:glycosyltransferase involved in cell wall biosynthesis